MYTHPTIFRIRRNERESMPLLPVHPDIKRLIDCLLLVARQRPHKSDICDKLPQIQPGQMARGPKPSMVEFNARNSDDVGDRRGWLCGETEHAPTTRSDSPGWSGRVTENCSISNKPLRAHHYRRVKRAQQNLRKRLTH